MARLTVTVVTPWLNNRFLERGYWGALRHEDCQVLVIDNASKPPLPNAIRLATNEGFSKPSNIGLQYARTDAVLFLNNDIEPVRDGWLEPIRDALEPGVLVGANLRFDGHGDVDGYPLPYLDGWCLAGMRDDLIDLGGWDEDFDEPSYFGDNDLCFRARMAGMTLRQADVQLTHLGNRTAGPAQLSERVQKVTDANYQRFSRRVREALQGATT